jgi:hypothetical protein
LKPNFSTFLVAFFIFLSSKQFAQHFSKLNVEVNAKTHILTVNQTLIYFNETQDTLLNLTLNDWNNAYSSNKTPMAKRFFDEFSRSFHFTKNENRGSTNEIKITQNNTTVNFVRTEENPDLIEIQLTNRILPQQKVEFQLSYQVKIPSDQFTKYGFGKNDKMYLKNWFLHPAKYENHNFIKYNNNNLDDIANSVADFEIHMKFSEKLSLQSDLGIQKTENSDGYKTIKLTGKNRSNFSIYLSEDKNFENYKNDVVEVVTNLNESKLEAIQKAILIDKVVQFVDQNVGKYQYSKITVSEADYSRNPLYGLNQLPYIVSPFSNEFLFEIKFLKTYLNNFLKNSLQLDARKNNWIFDGIQVYTMMKYIDEYHPNSKMMGSVAKFKLLKSFNLVNLDFNEQYSYFYMLMARKNLDQPLNESKDNLIKFNEQIANKYKAGLSLKYLDSYLDNNKVGNGIYEFLELNKQQPTTEVDFERLLKKHAAKNIDWFFSTIVNSRKIIDFKFENVTKTNDSITFTIKNKTQTNVPISVYGLKNKNIVFKKWFENISTDSTFTLAIKDANKIVLNYKNEVPEYNLRNNWNKFSGFNVFNRPFKFVFMEDLEDPYYNQILYVPTLTYNLYDGVSPGFRFHSKTILDKPFTFDINPTFATKTNNLVGFFSTSINQNYREGSLYNVRYNLSGSYSHYAPNATYSKINPVVFIRFRPKDLRNNQKEIIILRQVFVNREKLDINTKINNQNYSVFNAQYIKAKTEITKHYSFSNDFQISNQFGKLSTEFEFRRLFDNNRQINLRLYAGSFLYNSTNTDFFSFALDRPTDYLFDYNYYGRSESTGIFSQQIIIAEGGFKSKLNNPFANQWITTANASFNVWNWIEIYGDLGFLKNKLQNEKFVYDSGVRFNLVTDYFELYFPVYSNNGWEITQPNYNQKIRFIITLEPKILTNLFTRKWF